MDGRGNGRLSGIVLLLLSSFHQLVHVLGYFIIGYFGISLCRFNTRVSHHLLILLSGHLQKASKCRTNACWRDSSNSPLYQPRYLSHVCSTITCHAWAMGIWVCFHPLCYTGPISVQLWDE